MVYTDQRARLISELLGGIKLIKFFGESYRVDACERTPEAYFHLSLYSLGDPLHQAAQRFANQGALVSACFKLDSSPFY